MREERTSNRRFWAVGLVVVLGFSVAVSLYLMDRPGAKPESTAKPSSSASTSAAPDYDKIAAAALVSADLETLADHKPKFDEPETTSGDFGPLERCVPAWPPSLDLQGTATQTFTGEPTLEATGYAVSGSAAEAFADLRELWESKDCRKYKGDSGTNTTAYHFEREIKAPASVDEKSWFGACYVSPAKGVAFGGGPLPEEVRDFKLPVECRVVYVIDEHSMAEISASTIEYGNDNAARLLRLIAGEALSGKK